MQPRRTAVLFLLFIGVLSPGQLRADPATEAGYHFGKASQAARRGDLEAALEHYLVSNRLSPNAPVLFNIARCFELLGRPDEAFTFFSEHLAATPPGEGRAEGEEALARVLPQVARLNVRTKPPGATVYLDRRDLGAKGTTPRLLAHRPGEIAVIAELEGHHPARGEATLVKGEQVDVTLLLERIVGTVALTTEPPGAAVRVDDETGAVAGTSPADFALTPGSHDLFVTAAGHKPARRRVVVEAGARAEVALTLEPLPPPTGRITLTANQAGAVVTLDGEAAGFTPTVLDGVPLGRRALEVRLKGWRPWRGEVEVAEGAPVWANVALAPEIQDTGRGPWPWALAGAAAGVLGAGAVFGVLARRSEDAYDADPIEELRDEGRTRALLADTLLGTGLVLAGAAATVFVVTQPEEERDSTAMFSGGAAP